MKHLAHKISSYLFLAVLLVGTNSYAQEQKVDQETQVTMHDNGVLEVITNGVSNFFGAMKDKGVMSSLMLWVDDDETTIDNDPWEGFNRSIYGFNSAVDTVFKPIAEGYRDYTPDVVRSGIGNFFGNLGDVNTLINQVLQLKLEDGLLSAGRVLINTTIGLGGVIEVYDRPSVGEDFGQTFGAWGFGSGPYLVLPFLGPSTVRDGLGLIGNTVVFNDALTELTDEDSNFGIALLNAVRVRSAILPVTDLLEKSDDPYLSARSAYLQKRAYDIADGNISNDTDEF